MQLTIVPVWCNLSSAWLGNLILSWVCGGGFPDISPDSVKENDYITYEKKLYMIQQHEAAETCRKPSTTFSTLTILARAVIIQYQILQLTIFLYIKIYIFSYLLWNSVFLNGNLSNINNLMLLSPTYEYFTTGWMPRTFPTLSSEKTGDMYLNMGRKKTVLWK